MEIKLLDVVPESKTLQGNKSLLSQKARLARNRPRPEAPPSPNKFIIRQQDFTQGNNTAYISAEY